jgi:DNA-binding SARP family transcriptional activator
LPSQAPAPSRAARLKSAIGMESERDTVEDQNSGTPAERISPESRTPLTVPDSMSIRLLGAFSVVVSSRLIDESEWPLRKVRSLIKLLALAPGHQLHREQIMDVLWPDLEPEAAANNLHKTLHLVRRVIEPDLPPKTPSSFLHLQSDFVTLQPPGLLWIDVEAFREAATTARMTRDPVVYEEALSLYTGDLLPGDRYEDFSVGPREELRSLQFSLLLELSILRERSGEIGAAMDPLRQLVAMDPAHEEAHSALMRLLVRAGHRHLALRQFQHLTDALRRELDTEPDPSVQAMHEQIRAGNFVPESPTAGQHALTSSPLYERSDTSPLVGRDRELAELTTALADLSSNRGALVLVKGEAGMGKSRLAAELVQRAGRLGATALWGASYPQDQPIPYAPFVVALEGFAIRFTPSGLRSLVGDAAPELARLAPAIATALGADQIEGIGDAPDRRRLYGAVADFLGRLAARSPVVLVLDDLQSADETSLDLLHYLTRSLRQVPVLIIATFRTEEIGTSDHLGRLLAQLAQDGLATTIELQPLHVHEAHEIVSALLNDRPAPELVQSVHSISQGNPFFVIEAVEALRGRGFLRRADNRWHLHRSAAKLTREQLRRRPPS